MFQGKPRRLDTIGAEIIGKVVIYRKLGIKNAFRGGGYLLASLTIQFRSFQIHAQPIFILSTICLKPLPVVGFAIGLGLLTSCTFLPSAGPSASRIKSSADTGDEKKIGDYVLVTLDQKTVNALRPGGGGAGDLDDLASGGDDLAPQNPVVRKLLRQGSPELLRLPARQTVAQGDVLNIVIYDTGGGLFAAPTAADGTRPVGAVAQNLPAQLVDASGEITVPYAGRITVRGKTLAEVQKEIETQLKTKTVDPQVIVTLGDRIGGDRVSVSGDVKQPTQVPVVLAGTRVLDAIAAAGGSIGKEYETVVSVTRDGVTRSSTLREIFDYPRKNVLLQVGDSIVVRVRSQDFLSFGANGKVARFPFADDYLSLAEALATAGGPLDLRADPSSIFIFRVESSRLVRKMGYTPVDSSSSTCQVIYRLDLTKANGFFLANNFGIRNGDILYTTNAGSIGVMKFLNLINAITAPARSGLSTATGLDAL